MDFSSADAMLTFLPQVVAPAALSSSLTDPIGTSTGVFGGEVVALRLDIGFSDLGVLAHPAGVSFGDLVLTGYTGSVSGLNDRTVRRLSQIVNAALGAVSSHSASSISQASQATSLFSFIGGFVTEYAQLHYELPAVTAPVPDPSTWLLLLAALGGSGISGWRRRHFVSAS